MALPSRIVLVPIRSFSDAKSRLSPVLSADQRQRLAELCAARVLENAGVERTLVICDDPRVADWAERRGVDVLTVSAVGLNASLHEALPRVMATYSPVDVVIAHGDLAFPEALTNLDDIAPVGNDHGRRMFIVPDRHGTGTNVLGLGADLIDQWQFEYGPNSFEAHCTLARRLSATVRIIEHADLGVDIDTPEDLLDRRVCAIVGSLLPDWTPHEQ